MVCSAGLTVCEGKVIVCVCMCVSSPHKPIYSLSQILGQYFFFFSVTKALALIRFRFNVSRPPDNHKIILTHVPKSML